MNHRDYILDITKKYILEAEIYDKELGYTRSVYVTNKNKYITGTRGAKYSLTKDNDDIFFNLNLDRFEKYGHSGNTIVRQWIYPNFNLLGIDDTMYLPEVLKKNHKGIEESNKIVLEELNERKENYKKLYTENLKYVDEDFLKNVEINNQLYIGKTYNDDQFMFNTIFNLIPEDYLNKNFDINKINNKFSEILKIQQNIAVKELEEEKKNLTEKDQINEVNSVINLVKTGVKESIEENDRRIKSYKSNEIEIIDAINDILTRWPPILFPVPTFLSDDEDNSVFKDTTLIFGN